MKDSEDKEILMLKEKGHPLCKWPVVQQPEWRPLQPQNELLSIPVVVRILSLLKNFSGTFCDEKTFLDGNGLKSFSYFTLYTAMIIWR